MKLPDFQNHDGLNELRSRMGAPFRTFKSNLNIPLDVVIDGFDSIVIASDGTLEYKNEKVILHIRDIRGTRDNLPKYHVVECSTLKRMQREGRYNRYIVTRRTDGEFILNSPAGNLDLPEPKTYRLDICTNCRWNELRYDCEPDEFPLASWFEAVGDSYEPPPIDDLYSSQISPETAPPSNYPPGWSLLSLECRKRAQWKCDECNMDLKLQPRFLHAHHKRGTQYNSPEDLRALCIGCHAEQDRHDQVKNFRDYLEFMDKYGHVWKQRVEK